MLKPLTLLSGVFLLAMVAFTALAATPYSPEVHERFNALEGPTGERPALARKVARFVYDVSQDGGTQTAIPLGVRLPQNSILTRSYLYIVTQFTDSGSASVALSCEDADNIKVPYQATGDAAGTLIEGASTGAASAFKSGIGAQCEITATVASSTAGDQLTAGKLVGWVEYVVAE